MNGLKRSLPVLSGCRQTRGHFGILDKRRLVRTRHKQAQDMVHEVSLRGAKAPRKPHQGAIGQEHLALDAP